MKRMLTNKEYQRMSNEYDKIKVVCEYCKKHYNRVQKVIIPVWVDQQICPNCKNYVCRTKQIEFRNKMKVLLKEV